MTISSLHDAQGTVNPECHIRVKDKSSLDTKSSADKSSLDKNSVDESSLKYWHCGQRLIANSSWILTSCQLQRNTLAGTNHQDGEIGTETNRQIRRVKFSSVPWPTGSSGGHERSFSRDPLLVFFAEGPLWAVVAWAGMSTLWWCPSSISSADHGAAHSSQCPEGWFWRGYRACDMSKPCNFTSLDSCQKRVLWTHKEVDLAPHPAVGLVLQVEDAEKFPQALSFKSLDPFFRVSKQGPCFTTIEEDVGDNLLVRWCFEPKTCRA